jgi:cytochrome c-type biogenesis protein CcmH
MKGWTRPPAVLSAMVLAGLACFTLALLFWTGDSGSTTLPDRTRTVASILRCPVCHGESVWDSSTAMAGNMRSLIRHKLAHGATDKQVEDFFVVRYGDWILLSPPTSGIGIAVWIGPPILVLGGLALVCASVLAWRRNQAAGIGATTTMHSPEDSRAAIELLATRLESGELTSDEFTDRIRRTSSTVPAAPVPQVVRRATSLPLAGVVAGAIALAAVISLVYQPEDTSNEAVSPLQTAITSALLAVEQHPHSERDWLLLAQLQLAGDEIAPGTSSFVKARLIAPHNPAPALGLSYIYVGQEHPRKALAVLDQVADRAMHKGRFWLLEGMAYRQLHARGRAAKALLRFLRLSPKSTFTPTVSKWLKQMGRAT